MNETDSLGRARRRSQGGAGPKHLPSKDAPKAGDFVMEPPDHLEREAREWWIWAVEALDQMGILDAADAKHIELCAETFQTYRDSLDDIATLGRIMAQSTESGDTIYRRNPAFTTMEKARVTLRSFYSDLGLTPSARAKFGHGNEESDPFADLMESAKAN